MEISEDEISCFKELYLLKEKCKEGLDLPIVDNIEKIEIEKAVLNEIFLSVCFIVEKYSLKKIERQDFDKKREIENARNGDFISIWTLKPIFEKASRNFKPPLNWNKGICPFCKGKPLIAYLRKEDGKRILQCSICKTQWEFLRIKCPFCETDDIKDLRFFKTDDESPYRVDVCLQCKSYIKTLDKRREDAEDLEFLDIKTRYLDILAIKEGYGFGIRCSGLGKNPNTKSRTPRTNLKNGNG